MKGLKRQPFTCGSALSDCGHLLAPGVLSCPRARGPRNWTVYLYQAIWSAMY